ncbi:MAG: hypothetical protein ACXVCY_00055 [Pseudobdellovibrionaceae bacterium]
MKTVLSFFATTLFTANAFTQTSAELTCRAQAKELAMQTYSNCITQARNHQIEEVRKNYQKELSNLKVKYDNELKKIGGPKAEKASRSAAKPASNALPPKVVTTDITPNPAGPNKPKAVAVESEESSDNAKKASQEIDQNEIIEVPAE